jgi:hypothetical protein
MRQLIVLAFLTLNGVMQKDRGGGFTYGEWSLPLFGDPCTK